jgi:plastocyanin
MWRNASLVVALAAVALAAASSALASSSAGVKAPTLVGTVGPGYTITLRSGGKAVKTLKAGTYRLVVHDRASIHAFSLDGPGGLAKDVTAVPFVGTKSVTLRLKAGSYRYFCPPHQSIMFGTFVVH